jgi:hypothetical protein
MTAGGMLPAGKAADGARPAPGPAPALLHRHTVLLICVQALPPSPLPAESRPAATGQLPGPPPSPQPGTTPAGAPPAQMISTLAATLAWSRSAPRGRPTCPLAMAPMSRALPRPGLRLVTLRRRQQGCARWCRHAQFYAARVTQPQPTERRPACNNSGLSVPVRSRRHSPYHHRTFGALIYGISG